MPSSKTAVKAKPEHVNEALTEHMEVIGRCTVDTPRHGHVLLASSPEARYPYVYPRDSSSACQLFRRVAGSRHGYDARDTAFDLMRSMAGFMLSVQERDGSWGQRYSIEGENKSIYRQEDNVAHGIAILCNYALTARRLEREIPELDEILDAVNRALAHAMSHLYQKELHLFRSTTSIHESALEEGYTCWVNFSFLYAFSLADEVARELDGEDAIRPEHLRFRRELLYAVSELFQAEHRYVRRIEPTGRMDMRPDFTLLSPFYFGFLHDRDEIAAGVRYLEGKLYDPELGLIMRYLPFADDFATHIHAGNGPWAQYSAILAQYHYWAGNTARGDELLAQIDGYRNERGEIPEHLSTCRRFEDFMDGEWRTGVDFAKEFHKPILLEDLSFDHILEEANNMARSYEKTGTKCMIRQDTEGGGFIQFALPLVWSHVEYIRALMVKSGDWWKTGAAGQQG